VRVLDSIAVVAVVIAIILLTLVVARQRYMLRSSGGIPLAVRGHGHRWQYGVGRFAGGELQWFRAYGIGTRPSRTLRREEVLVIARHDATPNDMASLPSGAVIVECRDSVGTITLGLGEGAYTGFVSWLESATPRF
jgi:hypothetical protein